MRCAEFESRLNEVLDERLGLDSDPELVDHAQRCQPCRSLASSYEAIVTGLEQAKLPEASPALTARIVSALPASAAESARPDVIRGSFGARRPSLPSSDGKRRGSGWRRTLVGLAAAAALLVAVSLRWNAADRGQRPAGPEPGSIAVRSDASPQGAEVAPAPPSASDPYRALAAETSNSVSTAMRLFPGVSGTAEDAAGNSNDAQASGWVHGVSDGLRPVTRTTTSAVHSFFELLAGGDEGSRS